MHVYKLTIRKTFGENGELMSLIYAGPVNRSRSVCRFFHPIQGVVVIFLSSYFFTTLVFLKVKRHRDLYKLLWLEVKILNF